MSEPVSVVDVENLKGYYQTKYFGIEREVRAVDDITMSVRRNEIYGLAGESSSGKTTLIKFLAGAVRPPLELVDGSVTYHLPRGDVDLFAADDAEVEAIRWSNLSYIMQGSMSLLNPVRRIRTTFQDFALRPMGLPKREFWAAVEAHLQRLELPVNVLSAYPHQLSGGMRQRATIALATVCRPDFVIADEPTTALDVVVQKDVLAMLRDVQREIGSSVVFVTHDMSVHAAIADRVGIMYAGRLVEEAPTSTLFTRPSHPYTAHLVGSLPRIGDTTPKAALEGRPPNLAEPPAGCRFHPRCPLAIERCATEAPPLDAVGPDHRTACWRSDDVEPLVSLDDRTPVPSRSEAR